MHEQASGAPMNTPGIYTGPPPGGVVRDRRGEVHARGGKMFVQLWHVGRMAHPEISGFDVIARVGHRRERGDPHPIG